MTILEKAKNEIKSSRLAMAQYASALMKQGSFDLIHTAEELQEVIDKEIGHERLTILDLDRVRIPPGGSTVWSPPNLDEEQQLDLINGVIVARHPARVYLNESIRNLASRAAHLVL